MTAILIQSVIGLLTVAITGWVAGQQFRSGRIWEKRLEIYTNILEALNQMSEEMDQLIDEFEKPNVALTPAYRSQLASESAKARTALRKVARTGTLIISERATAIIDELLKRLDHMPWGDDFYDYINRYGIEVDAALPKLIAEGRSDLKASRPLPKIFTKIF